MPQHLLKHCKQQPRQGSNLNVINRAMGKEDFVCVCVCLCVCVCVIEYYSAIKNKAIMPFSVTWMDLQIIILSEVNQTGKEKYCMALLTCGI